MAQYAFDYENPPQIVPMLAHDGTKDSEDLFKNDEYIAQRKYNGTRVVAIRNGYNIRLMGRSWKNDFAELQRFPEHVAELRKLAPSHYVIDGEMVFYKEETMEEVFLTALATQERKKDLKAIYHVFDVLWVEDKYMERLGLMDRQSVLGVMFLTSPQLSLINHATIYQGEKEKRELWRTTIQMGGEGIMFKHKDSPYSETRDYAWLKYKPFKSADCIVLGYTTGKGIRSETFGALLLGQYDEEGRLWYVGKTSGMNDEELFEFKEKLKVFDVVTHPNVELNGVELEHAQKNLGWTFVEPDTVVVVNYLSRTPDKKFVFPRYAHVIRTDKEPKDCIWYES